MLRAFSTMAPLILLGACAASPPGTGAPPAPNPPAALTQPPGAAAAPSDAGAAKPKPSEDLADTARRAGYQVRSSRGQPVYCHDETPSGTRIPTTVCLTEAEFRARLRAADDVGNSILHSATPDRAR